MASAMTMTLMPTMALTPAITWWPRVLCSGRTTPLASTQPCHWMRYAGSTVRRFWRHIQTREDLQQLFKQSMRLGL